MLALWCPLQKMHLPIEDSGLQTRLEYIIPQYPTCTHLAQTLIVVCRILKPLLSGGGMSLWVCCIWFSWVTYQLLLSIWRCL